ncbi:type II toxin-antitoxin system Phd/YefM family antitoxin [Pseudomonas sp. NY15364]|uniref:type II toxin-antitoxin system Phd/YefM family antitoxin n=1 Tax=Pseudomonas sp. NY15364 TaxID=3400353 RepID=UPI003A8A01A7
MKQFDIAEAQAAFTEIVELAAGGEEILITKDGKPIARVLPARKSRVGLLVGACPPVPDDIDTPFSREIEEMFYGKGGDDAH